MSIRDTQFWREACGRADDATLHQINKWHWAAGQTGFNRLEDVPFEPTAADYIQPPAQITKPTRAILTRVNAARADQGQPLIDLGQYEEFKQFRKFLMLRSLTTR